MAWLSTRRQLHVAQLSLNFSRGNKCQLMAKFRLRELTESLVFVAEVAKRPEEFVCVAPFGALVRAHFSFLG